MRLKYYTLWIENEPKWLNATIESVREIVSDHGFSLYFDKCLSASEFIEKIKTSPNFLNKFDLILTDFDLGSGERGNTLIDLLRGNDPNFRNIKIYTDVIFYGQDQQGIRAALNGHFIEGVYVAQRETGQFLTKFESIFETTVKKIQDISMMRGLVISEASEMAIRVSNLISLLPEKLPENTIEEIRKYILSDIVGEDYLDKANLTYTSLQSSDLYELVSHQYFDDYKKLRILSKFVELKPDIGLQKKIFSKYYKEEIIDIRNELGHCEEVELEGVKVLSTKKGIKVFDDDKCKEIRINIIKHNEHLDKVEEYIQSLDSQTK